MAAGTRTEVEARTQELGRALYARLQAYRPSPGERLQDRLMVLLMRDQTLRDRLLRFVDVLAALEGDRTGTRTASLFREYFGTGFGHLPRGLRLALGLGRSSLLPSPLLAWGARRGTGLMASRFIVPPGHSSVHRALERLEKGGRHPSFDLLGEAVLSEEEARRYRQGYLDLVQDLGRAAAAGRRTPGGAASLQVSLKLSSLTSQFNLADPEGTVRRVRPALEEVCLAARAHGIGVAVDAEQHAYRDVAWRTVQEVLAPGGPLGDWPDGGVVVQSYLADADDHARAVIAFARRRGVPFQVRLVKGAYWDYEVIVAEQNGWPVPVQRDKGATDLAFERLVRLFLEEPSPLRLAVASHNIRSHAYAEAVREALGLPPGAVEHQTLYRTLEALSRGIAELGWPARDYVPVGALIPGMAYLVRRILENTSQVGFLTKSRLHEEAEALLAAPAQGGADPSHSRPPHSTGFANTPPARLFDAAERERFQRALEGTRARWGADYPLRLGAEAVESAQRLPSISPSHPDPARPVGWVHLAGVEEAERAIARANAAAPAWAARPPEERAAIGLRAAELLRSRREEVAAWVVHEGAKNWPGALADVEEAIDHLDWNARQLLRLAPLVQARYRPVGVVACIPPWNFPIAIPAGMVSAALMAGNAVILKPAGPTPIVAQALVDVLHAAGVPPEALIHLPGPGATVGAHLVQSRDVDMVAFTGSREVGTGTYRSAASVEPRRGGTKRVVAEMGGKNAIVVFPDADLDEAVLGILASAFGHAGQKCSACSRVLVHRQVLARLRHRLVEAARSLPVGPADDPATFINPVIDGGAREKIAAFRDAARREGRVLLDALDADATGPYCMGPLVVELDPAQARTARVAQEEIFGPILTLVPFESEEQAVSLVNSTVYALTLGVFSRSPGTIVRMVRACHAGNIYVNREITGARVGIEPFGGYRLSGTGPKAGGEDYLLAFLTRRSRREGRPPQGPAPLEPPPTGHSPRGSPTPWQAAAQERLRALREAGHGLANGDRGALDAAFGGPGRAGQALEGFFGALAYASEVTESQPTVALPGQTTFVRWSTPRGLGLVAVDEGASLGNVAGLIAGAMLAGNGLMVAAQGPSRLVAGTLVEALHRAGVPPTSLLLAPPEASLEELAAGPLHFAAVDLAEDRARSLNRVLAETSAREGQAWLKALVSVDEGPRPGEPGFLRRFAHPKVVAIKTLRHGAELELV